jgi:hypothetical protein
MNIEADLIGKRNEDGIRAKDGDEKWITITISPERTCSRAPDAIHLTWSIQSNILRT